MNLKFLNLELNDNETVIGNSKELVREFISYLRLTTIAIIFTYNIRIQIPIYIILTVSTISFIFLVLGTCVMLRNNSG